MPSLYDATMAPRARAPGLPRNCRNSGRASSPTIAEASKPTIVAAIRCQRSFNHLTMCLGYLQNIVREKMQKLSMRKREFQYQHSGGRTAPRPSSTAATSEAVTLSISSRHVSADVGVRVPFSLGDGERSLAEVIGSKLRKNAMRG